MTIKKMDFPVLANILLIGIIFTSCTVHKSFDNDAFLITKNSVGPIKLGMTIEQLKKLYSSYSFKFEPEYGYFIFKGKTMLINVWSKNDYETVSGIKVYSDKYYTEKGVRVGMSPQQLVDIYGYLDIKDDMESEDAYYSLPDLTVKKGNAFYSVGIATFPIDTSASVMKQQKVNSIEIYLWE